jgi:hypothetical protein
MIGRVTAVGLAVGVVMALPLPLPPSPPASANGAAFFNNADQISEDG